MTTTTGIDLADTLAREATAAGATVHGPMTLDSAFGLIASLAAMSHTTASGRRPQVLAWRPDALGVVDAWARLEALGVDPICPSMPSEAEARRAALSALDAVEVGVTATIGALADTGTVVVSSGPDRPRLAWLLPDRHVALVDVRTIYASMAAFFASAPGTVDAAHLAFVTGPSRTADIELTMTRGVHGPRELHVILVASS